MVKIEVFYPVNQKLCTVGSTGAKIDDCIDCFLVLLICHCLKNDSLGCIFSTVVTVQPPVDLSSPRNKKDNSVQMALISAEFTKACAFASIMLGLY